MSTRTPAPHEVAATAPTGAELFPLNIAQHGVAVSTEQDRVSSAQTQASLVIVEPALDADIFREAARLALADLDGSRVRVARIDGEWAQWIGPELPGATVHDVSREADPVAAADAIIDEIAHHRLELDGRTALVQTHLVQVGAAESRWLIIGHHVMSDGWSGELIQDRTLAYYEHLAHGAPAPEPTGASIRDVWAAVTETDRSAVLARWTARLDHLPERMTISERPGEPGAPAHYASVVVSAAATEALVAAAASSSWVQPAIAVAAAYTARCTGQPSVSLGFILGGRRTRAERAVVTMLARSVPLVIDVDETATLAATTRDVRRSIATANSLGAASAEELAAIVPAAWRLGRIQGPRVNVIPFEAAPQFTGHTARRGVLGRGHVDDLAITFTPAGDGIRVEVTGCDGAYSRADVELHAQRIGRLIERAGVTEAPLLGIDPAVDADDAARAAAHADGIDLVTASGMPPLVDEVTRFAAADGSATERFGVLHADGTVERLGPASETILFGGFPVYFSRVRLAVVQVDGVSGVDVRIEKRRVLVEVMTDRLADAGAHDAIVAGVEDVLHDVMPRTARRRVVLTPETAAGTAIVAASPAVETA